MIVTKLGVLTPPRTGGEGGEFRKNQPGLKRVGGEHFPPVLPPRRGGGAKVDLGGSIKFWHFQELLMLPPRRGGSQIGLGGSRGEHIS